MAFCGLADGRLAKPFLREVLATIHRDWESSRPVAVERTAQLLSRAADTGNRAAYRVAESLPSRLGVFATAIVGVVTQSALLVCRAGDCRLHRCRNRASRLLTRDQTWATNHLAAGMSAAEVAAHPLAGIVTNGLGTEWSCEFDRETFAAERGDRFLMCTDGFWRWRSEEAISDALALSGQAACVSSLIPIQLDEQLGRVPEDDATVVVVDIV